MNLRAITLLVFTQLWSLVALADTVTLTPLNPQVVGIQTGLGDSVNLSPGAAQFTIQGGPSGSISASIPGTLPIVTTCKRGVGLCLGPATIQIRDDTSQFSGSYIYVEPYPEDSDISFYCYNNGPTHATPNFSCTLDQIPYERFSNMTQISVNLSLTGDAFGDRDLLIVFQWNTGTFPTITSITPSVASNNPKTTNPIQAVIKGTGFPSSGTVDLVPAGASKGDIQVTPTFKSATEIDLSLSGFSNLPEGNRDLVITDSNGGPPTTLKGAFFVSSIGIQIEVNQGVPMSCSSSMPCIALHNTMIRAKLVCNGVTLTGGSCQTGKGAVVGRLYVTQGGTPVSGSPFAPDHPLSIPLASTPPSPRDRNMGRDALNFSLTDANNNQLDPGQYTFQVEIDPRNPTTAPTGASGQPDNAKNLVATVPNNVFTLSKVPSNYSFGYHFGSSQAPQTKGKMSIAVMVDMNDVAGNPPNTVPNYFELIRSAWPASRDWLPVTIVPSTIAYAGTDEGTQNLLRAWLERDASHSFVPFTHLVLLTSKLGDSGLSDCYWVEPTKVGTGGKFYCKSGAVLVRLRGVNTDGSVAHELGHTLLLGDSYDSDADNPNVNPVDKSPGSLCVFFGTGCPVDDGNYDSVFKTMSVAVPQSDPVIFQVYKQDFMGQTDRPYRWISTFLWNFLYPLFNTPPPTGNSRNSEENVLRPADQTTPVDLITVRASVNSDGTAAFLPFYRSTGTPPAVDTPDPTLPPPSYVIELQSVTGQVLDSRGFEPDFVGAGEIASIKLVSSYFSSVLAFPPGTVRFALKHNGVEIASLSVPPNPPTVQILPPLGGSALNGTVTINWSGASMSGAQLTYSLLYSTDGGRSWVPIATDLASTSYAWDTSTAAGSNSARLMVIANDGVNEGQDISAPLTLANKAPFAKISSPADGSVFAQGQPVTFSASVYDLQDGESPGGSITFTSDRDGLLGQGPGVIAQALSVGAHKITLKATNSAGLSTTSSINITVTSTYAQLNLSSSSVDFGSVAVGSTKDVQLNLSNTGNAPLVVSGLSVAGNGFTLVSPQPPVTAAAGASITLVLRFAPANGQSATGTFTITSNDLTLPIDILPLSGTGTGGGGGGGTSTAPQITPGGVVNAAGYAAKVSRGALAFAFGNNLASQFGQAQSIPLPYNQGGTSVTVAGIPAAVFITDPAFVEFQVPYEVPLGTSVPVVVTYNGVSSNTVNVTVADYAVGVFVYNRTSTIIDPDVFHTDGTLLTPNSPAIPSETVIVIANGIGKLNNPPATDAAVGPPYPTAVDTPVVTVGGVPAASKYAGLLAGLLGVVQMNVQLPANLPSGSLPMVIQFPGDSSPPVNLYVQGNITAVPKIGVTPSSLSFGSVAVGQNSSLSLAVLNTGAAALTVNSIASSNGTFAATSPATPFTVQPGGAGAVTVRFSPTAAGSQSGNLTISSNDPASPQFTVAVSGTGTAAAAPSITTSPSTLAFGSVTVGTPQSLMLTINNVGTATLSVSSISIDNKLFTPSATSASVAAGASFNVSVQFAPTAAGPQTGTLTLATNDPAHATVTVPLTGTGVTGAGTTINSTLTITGSGTSSSGIITATGKVTLSGVGTGTFSSSFSLTSAAVSGSAPITITITNGSPAGTLTAALSGSISLLSQIFAGTPTASGPATITVSSGTGGFAGATGSFNVTASGTGSGTTGSGGGSFSITGPGTLTIPGSSGSGTPTISAPTTTLQLGSVTVGQTANVPFNISNTGTAALTVSAIASSSASVTVTSPAIPFTVQPGATTPVTVKFAPTAAGAVNGILTITSNDPAHASVTVPLTGTGVAASAPTNVTLSVDGGLFNNAVGVPGAANAVFVNRLTPPSYPATLTAVQIYFGNRTNGLAAGASFTLVASTNPSGSASFSANTVGVLNLYAAGVSALGALNVYTLPAPITITSGDFVVGFLVAPDPSGVFPADEDQNTKSQGRSYVSTDGINFAVVDSLNANAAGNFGIRAVVTLGGSQ